MNRACSSIPDAEEAEVAALAGANLVLVRSARMPGDLESADYRRVARHRLAPHLGQRAASAGRTARGGDRTLRCRAPMRCGPEQLAADLGVTVDVVDPWSPLPAALELDVLTSDAKDASPRCSARWPMKPRAPPKLDFLNPRRAPEPPNRRAGDSSRVLRHGRRRGDVARSGGVSAVDDEIKQTQEAAKAMATAVKAAQDLERKQRISKRGGTATWFGS